MLANKLSETRRSEGKERICFARKYEKRFLRPTQKLPWDPFRCKLHLEKEREDKFGRKRSGEEKMREREMDKANELGKGNTCVSQIVATPAHEGRNGWRKGEGDDSSGIQSALLDSHTLVISWACC